MQVQKKSIMWEFNLNNLLVIDIILGIDWMLKNPIIIYCNKRKVFLAIDIEIGKKFFFRGKELENLLKKQLENQPLLISFVKETKHL